MGPSTDTHTLNARLLRFRSRPEHEDAYALAEDLIAAQRYGDARGVLVSAQADDEQQQGRLLVLEGRAWYMDRDLGRAQAALLKAAKLDPHYADAFRWLGEVLLKRGDPSRAVRAFERAQMLGADDPELPRLIERAQHLARHTPEAESERVEAVPTPSPLRPAPYPVAAPKASPGIAAPPSPAASSAAAPARSQGSAANAGPKIPSLTGAGASAAAAPAVRPRAVKPAFRNTANAPLGRPSPFPAPFADAAPRTPISPQPLDRAPVPEPPPEVAGWATARTRDYDVGFVDLSEGELDEPAERSRPGTASSPGQRSSPGSQSSPGSTSSPGARSSPGSQSSPGSMSSPGARSSPGSQSSPGVRSSPGSVSSPGARSSPGSQSSPGSMSSPGARSSPGSQSSPGSISSPGARSSPGSLSSPGVRSSPGSTSSPGRESSPGSASSPGSSSSPGARSSPGSMSSPGRVSSPGSTSPGRASSPGSSSSPGTRSSPGSSSSPGTRSSPGRISSPGALGVPLDAPTFDVDVEDAESVDVELDSAVASPAARRVSPTATRPGLGEAPMSLRQDLTPTSSWVAASVVATWPVQEPLAGSDTGAGSSVAGAGSPDLPLGEKAGQADDPAALLEMLRERGIFEPPQASSSAWTGQHEVPRSGTRLRNTLIGVWVATLLLSGGGYIGWQQWVAHRHAAAAQLLAEAKADAFEGDYAKLIDAERLLRLARDKHPRSLDIPRLELFVHAERVLESGSHELSSLRSSLLRAEHLHVDQAYIAAARAVVALYMGTPSEADAALKQALELAKGEPELLYIAGRLQQRLGQNDATARLQAAVAAAPGLIAASLALAEGQQDEGHESEALAGFEAILKREPKQLRAKLWRAFLTADAQEPAQAMAALDAVSREAHEGAPIDRILWALARARVLHRKGAVAEAGEAARDALSAGASDPRLMALAAGEARRTGQLGVAQQAASQAVSAAPGVIAYRVLLAGILVERHDGEAAWSMLAALPADEPALLVMRARAALQTGEPEALRAALAALETQSASAKPGVERLSLRIRLHALIDPNAKLIQDAKNLLHKAPGDPDALRALGESGLALHDAHEAVSAFQQLVAMTPDDAEAHHLLGRAKRLAVDPKGAEASLRRSLELSPGYVAAMVTLGGLLLDTGKYEEADAVYQALATHSVRDGRLGRAEALLGLGRVDDAQAQVSGLPDAQRNSVGARETGAKVALARHKSGEALTLLRPLLEGDARRASALALYGDALYAAGQVNPAAGAYDSALELDHDFPEALLGRGEVDIRAERFQEAVDVLEKAKTALETRLRAPEMRARMLTLLGRAYVQRAKKHDLETARDLLREAVKLPGPPAESFFWLGEALGGRITPESAAAFKRYMELEPQGDYVSRAKRALGPLL